jgi:hypothetical protein
LFETDVVFETTVELVIVGVVVEFLEFVVVIVSSKSVVIPYDDEVDSSSEFIDR